MVLDVAVVADPRPVDLRTRSDNAALADPSAAYDRGELINARAIPDNRVEMDAGERMDHLRLAGRRSDGKVGLIGASCASRVDSGAGSTANGVATGPSGASTA